MKTGLLSPSATNQNRSRCEGEAVKASSRGLRSLFFFPPELSLCPLKHERGSDKIVMNKFGLSMTEMASDGVKQIHLKPSITRNTSQPRHLRQVETTDPYYVPRQPSFVGARQSTGKILKLMA